VEREVWARGAMVVSILVLVVLIAVTPVLLGRPTSELESLPLLIVGLSQNRSWFIMELRSVLQPYRYDMIRLTFFNASVPSVNASFNVTDRYSLSHLLPVNVTFSLNAYFVDQDRNYFESNVSARVEDMEGRPVMVFILLDEGDNGSAPRPVQPPDDFRYDVPRRGNLN
jgi:hypothetical protein